jgi:hypothetical protein
VRPLREGYGLSPRLRREAALPKRTFLISVKVLVDTPGYVTAFRIAGKPRVMGTLTETAGELLDVYEHAPLPKVNWDVLEKIAAGRGRRSGGRK